MRDKLKKELSNIIRKYEDNPTDGINELAEFITNYHSGHHSSGLCTKSPFIKFIDFLPDPAFVINKEGIVVAWNPAMSKLTGVPANSVVGKGDFEYIKIIHGQRTPGLIDMLIGCDEIGQIEFQAVSRRGNALAAEIRIENLGQRRSTDLWIQAAPVLDDSGRTIGAIEIMRDISGRKQTENINLILYKISAALNSEMNNTEFFREVHESLKKFIDAENFFVALFNKEHRNLIFPYYSDNKDYISPDQTISIVDGKSLSGRVIDTGLPLLLDEFDFRNNPELSFIGSPAKSWLGVPLKVQDKILGVMAIQSYRESGVYNTQDMDMMVAISEQVAAALLRSKAESALLESEKKFRSVFENATVAIFQFSASGDIVIANPAMAAIMGYDSVDEMLAERPSILDYVYDRREHFRLLKKVIKEKSISGFSIRIKHSTNKEKWLTLNARTLFDDNGRPVIYSGTAFDSTPQILAERKIFRHKSRFMQLFESSPQAIVLTDSKGNVVDTNKAFTELFGYTADQMAPCCSNLCPDGKGKIQTNLKKILDGDTFRSEDMRRANDGRLVPVSILGYPFIYDGVISGTFIIYDDISQRKEYERRLSHQSLHDSLTGLPNRTLFLKRLEQTLNLSRNNPDHNFAVLMLDIDMFKRINDSLGHHAGDTLLIEVARRIRNCIRAVDTVARMGGDEFAVLIDGFNTPQQVIQIIRSIRNEICTPLKIASKEIVISSSIGIVFKTSSYEKPEHIVRDADISMYKAKEQGVNKFKVFNKSMYEKALQSLIVETEIRQGIPENEFFPYFQPIYSLKSNRLAGFEALVRWNHPERGFLTPNHIIPVAEETGLIVELDRDVLLKACQHLADWLDKYPSIDDLFLTTNLSPRQLSKPDLAHALKKILNRTGISPRNIKLEITESAIMERNAASTQNLEEIEEMGIRLAVDDFGTGYSSLAQLQRFPASTLKIDRSFVSRMAEDHESLEIVRAVNALGHSLNMDVIAEGVETRQQLLLLKEIGCDCVQGFYFDKPHDSSDAEKLIKMRSEGFCPPGLTSI